MSEPTTRRQFFRAALGGVAAFAGLSVAAKAAEPELVEATVVIDPDWAAIGEARLAVIDAMEVLDTWDADRWEAGTITLIGEAGPETISIPQSYTLE